MGSYQKKNKFVTNFFSSDSTSQKQQ